MYILGLSAYMHDTAACLIHDGQIIAIAEEERFTRQRHAWRQMPHHAARYCLDVAGIELDDIDYVVTGWNATSDDPLHLIGRQEVQQRHIYDMYRLFPPALFPCRNYPALAHVNHHLAHAASAFRCSGMDEVTIIVMDGRGEHAATSIYHGKDNQIRLLRSFDIAESLGFFYLAITRFIGFGGWGEGKTMGYAPLGTPRYDFAYMRPCDDGYTIDWDTPVPRNDRQSARGDCTLEIMPAWMQRLERQFGAPCRVTTRFDLLSGREITQREDTQLYRDIAASAQRKLEEIGLHLVRQAVAQTGCRNVVLAGGVALNCVMNGKIITEQLADRLFVQPAAQDAGTSVGAALELAAQLGDPVHTVMHHAAYGPAFSDAVIKTVLDHAGCAYTYCADPALQAAQLIAENQVLAWFQGRMELGPRALGKRSILANPAAPGMREHLNVNVKHRETFRPYALSLLHEAGDDLFAAWAASPFMLLSFDVKPEWHARLREGLHDDMSTRPQTVEKVHDPLYWQLIQHFKQLSGIPAVINTSFNDYGAPLVCNPYDALHTFFTTAIDSMLIGSFLLSKKRRAHAG